MHNTFINKFRKHYVNINYWSCCNNITYSWYCLGHRQVYFKKLKPAILLVLWIFISYLSYTTFMSVYGEIQFNQLKVKRFKVVIESLKDIRDAQLAHRTVTGKFQNNFDDLVSLLIPPSLQ